MKKLDVEKIEKYRGSTDKSKNSYLKNIYLDGGQKWTECLCFEENRKRFNTAFFEWYDKKI